MEEGNAGILNRLLKLVFFFTVLFSLVFCVTWQNVKMYLLQRELEELAITDSTAVASISA